MIKRYTFLQHPFYFVLANAMKMVNGLEKCVAIFYNNDSSKVEILSFKDKISNVFIDDIAVLVQVRNTKGRFNWLNKEQLSFEINTTNKNQLSFEDEENSSILELRFFNFYDKKYDVLYFYFKNTIGNFKLSSSNEKMNITIKEVVQNLIYNQVDLIIKSNDNNLQIHQKIAKNLQNNSLKDKLTLLENNQFEHAKSTYSYLLNKILLNETIDFVLSKKAVKKLMAYNTDLLIIEQVLTQTIELIINKYNNIDFYEISDLEIVSINDNLKKASISIKQEGLIKTQQYLDRYEAAAKLTMAKNEKITGLNIGNNCSPQVSPAAISDILKKHHKKIITLFNQYPHKWSCLKENFKPIKNLTQDYLVTRKKSNTAINFL